MDIDMDRIDEIIGLAKAKSEALVKRDAGILAKMLHEDFRYTNSQGMTCDKAGYIGIFSGPAEMTFRSQEYKNIEVKLHGGIAIFEAEVLDKFLFQGRERSGKFRTMQIYLLENDQWKWLRGMTVETA